MNKHIDENKIEQVIKANKPQISRDEKFKGILRAQTLGALSEAPAKKMFNFQAWIPGAVALAVILIGVAVALLQGGTPSLLSSGVSVSKVGSNAFGSLSDLSGTGSTSGGTATSESAGGATPTAAVPMMAAAGTSASGDSANSGMSASIIARPILPPNPYQEVTPNYVYKGDTFTQDQSTMDVLKRVVAPISADQATAAIEGSNFGLVNLGSFGNMQLQNITLSENQNFGYTINLDLTDGSFSIYQNYSTWPQDNNPKPLTASDVPSNDAIIKIANDFLKAHSFDMGSYGTPTVVNNVAYAIPFAQDGSTGSTGGGTSSGASVNMPMIPYYPDTVSVTYPLVVNGKTVYDVSGNVTGLDVEVNIRYSRVSNVSGVTAQNYQASSYSAITDVQKIISLAEAPSMYPIIYNGTESDTVKVSGSSGGVKTAEVDLGTPTLGYADMYTYTNNTSNEFLVPAYIFPVTSDPSQYVPSKNVVVPLIADFINNSGPSNVVPLNSAAPGAASGASSGE